VADRAAVLRSGRVVREATMVEFRQTAQRRLRAVVRAPSAEDVRAAASARALTVTAELAGAGEVRVVGLVEGHANDVVGFLGGYEVIDLVFAEPDLEETVLGIYSDPDDPDAPPDEPPVPARRALAQEEAQ